LASSLIFHLVLKVGVDFGRSGSLLDTCLVEEDVVRFVRVCCCVLCDGVCSDASKVNYLMDIDRGALRDWHSMVLRSGLVNSQSVRIG
jgi:hypothetical protein